MPTFAQDAANSSAPKGFWRNFVVASPNPCTMPGGVQLDRAPMCPCLECWESGSPYHVSRPKAPKAPKAPKEEKKMPPSASSSLFKKSPLVFLKRNASVVSVASDMRPLRQANSMASSASVYSADY